MDNAQQMALLKEAIRTDYRGTFEELWSEQPQEGEQMPEQEMSSQEPQMQPAAPMQGDPSSMDAGMPMQGDLVRSYESQAAGVNNLPMGEDVSGVIADPGSYREGGVENLDIYKRTYGNK